MRENIYGKKGERALKTPRMTVAVGKKKALIAPEIWVDACEEGQGGEGEDAFVLAFVLSPARVSGASCAP